jgi:hypothetical protein
MTPPLGLVVSRVRERTTVYRETLGFPDPQTSQMQVLADDPPQYLGGQNSHLSLNRNRHTEHRSFGGFFGSCPHQLICREPRYGLEPNVISYPTGAQSKLLGNSPGLRGKVSSEMPIGKYPLLY